jgi:pyroglutamyl-peptidase
MTITGLLTGFAPFAGLPDNPAAELLPLFEGAVIGGVVIRTRQVPVDRHLVPGLIDELVGELRPAFVLGLGLATGSATFRLEQIAINAAAFAVADNLGYVAKGERIDPDGPPARFATWDAEAIEAALLAADLPAEKSWHGGTHLCNLALYCSLAALERHGLGGRPCGFLHLPYTTVQVARFLREAAPDRAPLTPRALPSLPLATQAEALGIVLSQLAAATPAPADRA